MLMLSTEEEEISADEAAEVLLLSADVLLSEEEADAADTAAVLSLPAEEAVPDRADAAASAGALTLPASAEDDTASASGALAFADTGSSDFEQALISIAAPRRPVSRTFHLFFLNSCIC